MSGLIAGEERGMMRRETWEKGKRETKERRRRREQIGDFLLFSQD